MKMGGLAKKYKLNPLLTDPPIFNPSVIENNSHYLSVEVGVLLPSALWMIHVF